MALSYKQISSRLARQIKLLMTDVDGTMTTGDGSLSHAAVEAVRQLEQQGITVGLVSGRTLSGLEFLARDFGISGPIIAENGGVAKLRVDSEIVNLGYSRQPAIQALNKLKSLFPAAIQEREDNKDRLVDIVFWSRGVRTEELIEHLEDTDLLDSSYILHLVQKGVSKGKTLMGLLEKLGDGGIHPTETMVVGDSSTDLSMFELFTHSVLISNPRLPLKQRNKLQKVASYVSNQPFAQGFAEVVLHIVNVRTSVA